VSTLPYGWTARDLDAVTKLAGYFRADPRGILGIFNSESGLYPHLAGPAGYFGLIMAHPKFIDNVIGRSWADLVTYGSIVDQLAAIKVFWDATAKNSLSGDSVSTRARKLGVRGDTVLYSLNFVPAYFAKMTSAKQGMVIQNGGPDGGQFYHDNPGFDLDHKGYITVLDVQKRIDRMIKEGLANSTTAPLFGNVKKPRSLLTYGVVAGFLGAGVYLIAKD
jgi:hypothetical protein